MKPVDDSFRSSGLKEQVHLQWKMKCYYLESDFTFPFLIYKEMHYIRQSPKPHLVLGLHDIKKV